MYRLDVPFARCFDVLSFQRRGPVRNRMVVQSCVLLCVTWMLTSWQPAHGQSPSLVQRIPGSANALALWNAERVFASPMAQREKWNEKFQKAYVAGLASVPPGSKYVVVASEIDVQKWQSVWSLAEFDLSADVNLARIARQYEGMLDEVAGLGTVALSQDAYVVQIGEQQVAAFAPGNRQAVSRWLRETQGSHSISPYLQHAIARAQSSDVVEAFDFADAIPKKVIEGKIQSSQTLAGKTKAEVAAVTNVATGIQGVTLEVIVRESAVARLVVDFQSDASPLAAVAKSLLIEVLGDAGMKIDDMDSWKARVEGTKVILQGDLSPSGLQQAFQLIDQPISSFIADAQGADEAAGNDRSQAYASQHYFQGITRILTEIKTSANKKDNELSRYARWFDKWSDEIEAQPILNVDTELLNFGRAVSRTLRDCSDSIRGVGQRSAVRSTEQGYGTTYNPYQNWYSYVSPTNVAQQRLAVNQQEKIRGAVSARELFRSIEDETSKMRQVLTERYKVPF